MKKQTKLRILGGGIVILIFILSAAYFAVSPRLTQASTDGQTWLPLIYSPAMPEPGEYIVIGWNDLGMHCYDQDYATLSILPPYNTLWAQVVKVGDPPQVITTGIKVEFSFPDNTDSASKINFWQYEDKLFGIDLPPNTGLTGTGLAGEMEIAAGGNYFLAEGIPLTEFSDSAPSTSAPYQLAHLVVKNTVTNQIIAETTMVAPVSSEMRCDTCHNEEDPSNFRRDILLVHDDEENTNLTGQADAGNPILCASCHADPALGLEGDPELPPLSLAIHKKHAEETQDCYACHPGNQTQCLRDVMSQPPTSYWCTNCHGDMLAVGDENRLPWTDEPRCETCHGADHAENPGILYRFSIGHGGLYCESCHNSTHAILPSSEARDNLQSIALQGHEGTIEECTVCHLTTPTGGGPHTP